MLKKMEKMDERFCTIMSSIFLTAIIEAVVWTAAIICVYLGIECEKLYALLFSVMITAPAVAFVVTVLIFAACYWFKGRQES